MIRVALLPLAALTLLASCQGDDGTLPPAHQIADGTWGADGSGLIVQQGAAHLHIGCTFGDFPAPVPLDEDGRFSVAGSYMLRAYPVAVGPSLPATFSGLVRGNELTVGVTVNDTVQGGWVTLGPVRLELGREPRMGPCPICVDPPTMMPLR